jgi:hypothetical protein
MDSLGRFMSPGDLSSLWQKPDANQYHLNYENSCSLNYTFGTACLFDAAMNARYGKPSSLAQFEAFIDHANDTPLPSTGTIYWQMNKGWPSLLWNLYGSDGDQAGSYVGAQEANRPLHALRTLAPSSLSAVATTRQAGPDGADLATTVTIRNTSPSAVVFLLRADVRRGTASGQELPGDNELRSSTWQDNDITLFPGESQTLTVTYDSADLEGATPVISVSGWNAAKVDIVAPSPNGGWESARDTGER